MAEIPQSIVRLREEHALMGRVLDGLDLLAVRAGGGATVSRGLIEGTVDFFRQLADRRHHAREEEALFPLLAGRGVPAESGSLAAVRREHEEARVLLRVLGRSAVGPRRAADLAVAVRAYVTLMRSHFAKEEEVLFTPAERVLSADDDRRVLAAFERIEDREGGARAYEALLEVGRALERACRAEVQEAANAARAGVVAAEVMRPNLPALGADESLAHAARLMDSLDVRELPVVDGGELVGILAQRDLQPHLGHYEWTVVRAAMTPCPITVAPHTPVRDVARLLLERCFNSVPVVAGRALVGMIGRRDLVRLLAGILD